MVSPAQENKRQSELMLFIPQGNSLEVSANARTILKVLHDITHNELQS
jgi:hypothetical protein